MLLHSGLRHGPDAADRYAELVFAAIGVVVEDPDRPGAVAIPRCRGLRAIPLRLARGRVAPERRVGRPRHMLVFRIAPDGLVEVAGLVHDGMLLPRAARRLRDAR